jgi:hypothetical protein
MPINRLQIPTINWHRYHIIYQRVALQRENIAIYIEASRPAVGERFVLGALEARSCGRISLAIDTISPSRLFFPDRLKLGIMRSLLVLGVLLCIVAAANGFIHTARWGSAIIKSRSASALTMSLLPQLKGQVQTVNGKLVSVNVVRDLELTDVNGELKTVGSLMGRGKSVVVFLRHLGCPFCWAYVDLWNSFVPRMRKSGVAGPIFISIGDTDKLRLFLAQNPDADPAQFLTDDYTMGAYEAVGFGKILDDRGATRRGALRIRRPRFGLKTWRSFLKNAARLMPIPGGSLRKGRFPSAVNQLGGTIGMSKNDVVYMYADGVPGDHPLPSAVLDQLDKA